MSRDKADGGGSTNMKSRRSSTLKKDSGLDPCGICSKECKAEDRAINCDGCHVWHHTACMKIPKSVYEYYKDHGMAKLGFSWKCEVCSDKPVMAMEEHIKETSKALSTMQEEIESLRNMMKEEKQGRKEEMKEGIGSLKEILKEKKIEARSYAQVTAFSPEDTKAMNKLATFVASKQKGIKEDREARENNIIIKNMEEQDKESAENLNSKFENLCKEIAFEIKPASIERVGKLRLKKPIDENKDKSEIKTNPSENKPKKENSRPIKVCFANSFDKRLFFSKLRNLKGVKSYETVNICHDMGFEDREENKRLLTEAYNLNQKNKNEGTLGYKYKVRGPPWAMNIVKVKN